MWYTNEIKRTLLITLQYFCRVISLVRKQCEHQGQQNRKLLLLLVVVLVLVLVLVLVVVVLSPWASLGRNQSPVRRLVWLW